MIKAAAKPTTIMAAKMIAIKIASFLNMAVLAKPTAALHAPTLGTAPGRVAEIGHKDRHTILRNPALQEP